jgi:hypothetical protein
LKRAAKMRKTDLENNNETEIMDRVQMAKDMGHSVNIRLENINKVRNRLYSNVRLFGGSGGQLKSHQNQWYYVFIDKS